MSRHPPTPTGGVHSDSDTDLRYFRGRMVVGLTIEYPTAITERRPQLRPYPRADDGDGAPDEFKQVPALESMAIAEGEVSTEAE